MASDKSHTKGQWLKNCNCAYGCPRDCNVLLTRGDLETESEPINNPVTGAEHRIRVRCRRASSITTQRSPHGF